MGEKAHGWQKNSLFTHYASTETDHTNVNLNHGYRNPPNGPFNSYIHNHYHFTNLPIAQNPKANFLQNPEEFLSSIWVPKHVHSCIEQPQVPSPSCINQKGDFRENYRNSQTFVRTNHMITYYAPHKRMTIHFPRGPKDGDIFCSQRVDNMLVLGTVSRLNPWDHSLHFSGYLWDGGFYRVHGAKDGVLLLKVMDDDVFASPKENKTLTCYFSEYDTALHYTKVPKKGDIVRPQQKNNVITLDIVPTENARESGYRGLYSFNEDEVALF